LFQNASGRGFHPGLDAQPAHLGVTLTQRPARLYCVLGSLTGNLEFVLVRAGGWPPLSVIRGWGMRLLPAVFLDELLDIVDMGEDELGFF